MEPTALERNLENAIGKYFSDETEYIKVMNLCLQLSEEYATHQPTGVHRPTVDNTTSPPQPQQPTAKVTVADKFPAIKSEEGLKKAVSEINFEGITGKPGFYFGWRKCFEWMQPFLYDAPDDKPEVGEDEINKVAIEAIPKDLYKDHSGFTTIEDRNFYKRRTLIAGIRIGLKLSTPSEAKECDGPHCQECELMCPNQLEKKVDAPDDKGKEGEG